MSNRSLKKLSYLGRTKCFGLLLILTIITISVGLLFTNAAPAPSLSSALLPVLQQPPSNIVISQIYGGGGNSGSTYRNDYIELFNRGNATVNVNGWTVQYASAIGDTWQITTLSGSIAPGHYYLIKQAQGAAGTTELPFADAVGSIQMSATQGKVALLNGEGCLNIDQGGWDCEWDGVQVLDLVGYGSETTTYEGDGPTVGPTNTTAVLRGANGCIDTNDNRTDFDSGNPSPRNASAAANTCVVPNPSTSVVISEFRTRGPNGGNDEFVELYNKSDAAIDISGWKIKGSNNTGSVSTRVTVSANTSLPAHKHFLVTNVNASFGYSGTRAGNQTYTLGIADNGGIALTRPDDTIIDQVGMSSGSAFKEGRVLESFTINVDRSYERKPGALAGSGQDTDDNRSDSLIRTPSDPQNLANSPTPEIMVKIIHIDVGQGDATLIVGPSKTLLFDAGPTGTSYQIRSVLSSHSLTSLDYFVAGHYHADHIGSIDELINSGIALNLASYDRAGDYSSQAFNQYLSAVGTKRTTINLGQQIDLGGGCVITCIAVNGQTSHGTVTPTDENDRSIALVLRFGTFDYFIASDLTGGGSSTADVESFIARDAGNVDVLHVGHHGSRTSTNQTLVSTLNPEQAVISLGNGNSYGHPTQEVLDRLSSPTNMNTIWQTEAGAGGTSPKVRIGGNVIFLTNGTVYSVATSMDPQTYSYLTDGIAGGALPSLQAIVGGPYSGTTNLAVQFDGSASAVPGGTISAYQWNFGDGGTGSGVTPTHIYSAAGTYTITLTVTDNNGAKASALGVATIVPPNQPPVANAGGPYNAPSGTAIQFSGNSSHDPDGTIVSYEWNFGNGGTASDASPSHAYSLPGNYNAVLTVTDNSGATSTGSATVTIANRPPQANAGGPYSGPKQTSIQFQGGASIDPDGSIVSYAWNFGDGNTGSGVAPNHSYTSIGNYTVSLTVTDNLGSTSSITTTANINTAPIANAGGSYTGLSGSAVQLNGSASNDTDGSIISYQWNFGDGSTGSGESPLHVYSSVGTYVVTLTVVDNMGAWTNASAVATITSPSNQLPLANPGGPYSAVSGTPVQFNGTGSSDPDGTITQYQWNFADGAASGASPSHTFTSSGTHLVTLTVTDNSGATSWKSIDVNVAPSEQGGPNDPPTEPPDPPIVIWDPTNRDSLNDPANRRGNAPNTTTGNNNFQIVAPIVSLPGRGLDLNLNLVYNSLVWNKSGNEISFDIDHDFPAPGWQLGFGKMVAMGTAGALLIEPDGTRHSFTGEVFDYHYGPPLNGNVRTFKGRTTDGSQIEYRCEMGTYPRGVARYPNGTVVYYANYHEDDSHPHNYAYPYAIVDANGNWIAIKYVTPWEQAEPRIERIIDSVGRVIAFHYDAAKRLTSITGPGLPDDNGAATTQTFVRIHYKTQGLSLTGAFSGLTPRATSTSFSAIDAIYYPATGKGYWFGDDSYSSYGMITKVAEERGMSFTAGANSNEQGTILEGTVTRQQSYNYPSSPAGLNAAPSFTQLTEAWDGGPSTSPMTLFSFVDNSGANERTMTITNPNGTKSIQKSFNFTNAASGDPNKFKDGLMKEQQAADSSGNVLSKTIFAWEKGEDDAPRLLTTETTDERGQVLVTSYDQYGTNNSVGRIRQYDYDGTTVIHTTRNAYISYTDDDLAQGIDPTFGIKVIHPRRVNMVESVKMFSGDDSSNVLAAQTIFRYDEYTEPLKAYAPDYLNSDDLFIYGEPRHNPISGIIHHSGRFNPMPFNEQNGGGTGSEYITRRGNMTSIERYADTSNSASPANPVTESRKYDMAGNVITASRTCCEQTTSVFELASQYAFLVSQTRGAGDPNSLARITTTTQYDLSTGLRLSATDANGLLSRMTYFPISLRPKEISYSTGAVTSFEYDDIAGKAVQTARLSANGTIANQTTKYLNGLGQVVREEALGPNNVIDIVETVYDQFGRLQMRSRPYQNGESVDDITWTETSYDNAGRVIKVREDATHSIGGDPGTETDYAYNEPTRPQGASSDLGQTTKVTDPWGRWRWSRADANGRLVEVIEPNPAGGAGFKTTYAYDVLGNLVRVDQGNQVRRFKYDSLGRLTQQKLAEASATLNSAGERVTTEPDSERWSDVLTYDAGSNVTSHTDARGVRTVFSYEVAAGQNDPLGRLQSVSYDTSRVDGSLNVLSSPIVTYQYRTKSSPTSVVDVNQLKQVIAAGVATEDYDYDAEGRLNERRLVFANRSQPMTITYGYDTLSRLNQITYPEQYQPNGSAVRKVVTSSHDVASRLTSLHVNGTNYASQIAYNPASQIKTQVVGNGPNQITENFTYEPSLGLLTGQTVQRAGSTLMNLSYSYSQSYPCEDCDPEVNPQPQSSSSARTGQITRIVNNITGKRQDVSYDSLGRLKNVRQGVWTGSIPNRIFQSDWSQTYTYDRYGNRTSVTALGANDDPSGTSDGHSSLAYEASSNRITTSGFSYDAAGNQLTNGTGQSFVYDAAGRLAQVKDQNGVTAATYSYGASNHRLITQTGNESSPNKTYYIWEGDSVIAEYTDPSGAVMPQWSRNYIYLGSRLLASQEPNGTGGEIVRYHHADRLGTRLITNDTDTTYFQQANFPFGTALEAESSSGTNPTTRRFTTYDRSSTSGLDYAVNRTYDSRQGRFTQPDPLGVGAVNLADPQSLNMYSYVGNDPMNRVDPNGQFWGALFRLIAGLFHNLKPNIINGSFSYGNHPPVSVSFTTNFQNIGVGYGGISIPLRSGGKWLPEMLKPRQGLCDYLVSRMWDLFKSHDNEVGSKFSGDRRGRTPTDCFIYAQNVLSYAYDQIGRKDIGNGIRAGFKDARGNPESGVDLAKYLRSLGWHTYYWNPDVKNPKDRDPEHSFAYRKALKTGMYYGIGVDEYVINYRKSTSGSSNDMVAFEAFSSARFGFGIARGGYHNFMYSTGMVFEVHWDQEGADLYERSSLYDFDFQDGVILTPPDCK